MSLEDITEAASSLSESVADDAVKDVLDEIRTIAVSLATIAAKRPLSEEETSQRTEIETVLGKVAQEIAQKSDPNAPTSRSRGMTGMPTSTSSGDPTVRMVIPPDEKTKEAGIFNFINTYVPELEANKNLTVDKLGTIVETSKMVPKSMPFFNSRSSGWIRGKIFQYLKALGNRKTIEGKYEFLIEVKAVFDAAA